MRPDFNIHSVELFYSRGKRGRAVLFDEAGQIKHVDIFAPQHGHEAPQLKRIRQKPDPRIDARKFRVVFAHHIRELLFCLRQRVAVARDLLAQALERRLRRPMDEFGHAHPFKVKR